ncbi:MAG: glycosyltransferase family 2 protein [Deltaproteobacteria bacterium]|nr:glycosyltransferase family 2 protein [Deltaproteobacteria bacterium]
MSNEQPQHRQQDGACSANMDISIIIVNWNTAELLRNCLDSITKTVHSIRYEIIVVDNASTDDSVAMLRESHPDIRVIENKENRGFGTANNQAMRVMSGKYALLLNSDTVLQENAVKELLTFMETQRDAAIACGQLLNEDGSKQNSIASFPSIFTLLINMALVEFLFPRRYPSKRWHYDTPLAIDYGIGACLMVRKQAIDEVGMFDERYFFYFEETDWALQMKRAGWKNYHVPTALIYHLRGQSIGQNIGSRIVFYRSCYQFFRKWKSRPHYLFIRSVIFLRLCINWFFTSATMMVLLGGQKTLRARWSTYSRLILWHLQKEVPSLPQSTK